MSAKILFKIGVVFRLVLMPFFSHKDLISTYRQTEQFIFHGQPWLSLANPISRFIEAMTIKFFSFFGGHNFFHSLQPTIHQNFYDIPQITSLLFIYKLPYLLAEIISWWFIFKYFLKPTKKNILMVVFNPIIIYSVYLFGRYESLVILFSLLLLRQLQKKEIKIIPLITSVFLLIFSRIALIFLLPSFLFLKTKWSKKILLFTIPLFSFLIFLLIDQSYGKPNVVNWISKTAHTYYAFEASFNLGHNASLYMFFIILTFFLLKTAKVFYLEKKIRFYSNAFIFSFVSLGILFSYYSTSIFHPQYLSWFLPFYWIIMEKFKKEKVLLLNFLLINLFFLPFLIFWGYRTTLGLFIPALKIIPESRAISTGNILPENFFPILNRIANIAKSVLSAIFLFTLAEILKLIDTKEN